MPVDPKLLAAVQEKISASQWMPAKLPLKHTRVLPKSDGTGGATHWKGSPRTEKPPLVPIVPQKKAAQVKSAGPTSEVLSGFNPLNMYGGGVLGGLSALAMPTRSLARQAEYDSTDNFGRALGNVLIPGMGAYNGFKRLGAGIRSPEMKSLKNRRQADKLQRELSMSGVQQAAAPEKKEEEQAPGDSKSVGWKSEYAGLALNPLSLFGGNVLGAGAAGLTPTRTLDEQAGADDEVMGNLLIPGRGAYNYMKRIGAATRSPEMLHLRNKAKQKKLEKLQAKANPPAEAGEGAKAAAWAKLSLAEKAAQVKAALDPAVIAPAAAGVLGGGIGAATAGKGKRLRNALLGAGLGAGVGGAAEYGLPGVGLGMKYNVQDLVDAIRGQTTLGWLGKGVDRAGEMAAYALRRRSTLPGLDMMDFSKGSQARQKAARVYEAAESVDDMPIKETRKSHKKCAPGEFGMNKEGNDLAGHDERFYFGCKVAFEIPEVVRNMFNPQHQMGQMTMGGAALGGLGGLAAGAMGAGKGKRLRGALGGALAGALGGGAAGAAGHHFAPEQSKQMLNYLRQMYANQAGGRATPGESADAYTDMNPNALPASTRAMPGIGMG